MTHARVEVDRLRWELHDRPCAAPGAIARLPAAVAAASRLHAATTHSGAPRWVRLLARHEAQADVFASDHRCAAYYARATSIRVPGVLGVEPGRVWLDRIEWSHLTEPRPAVIDAFVSSAISTPLQDGAVVAIGPPHVDKHGYLVTEDCGILARFEPDQRSLLAEMLYGLADLDAVLASTAAERLTGVPESALLPVTQRACASLMLDWSPVAFGLSVHQIGRWGEQLGSPTSAFTLLGDELLHRLDLAHAHRHAVTTLASPGSVRQLLSRSC